MQALPDQFEGLFREVLAARHRRGGQHPVGTWSAGDGVSTSMISVSSWKMAQLSEITVGNLPPEADHRRAWGLDFLGRQGKECLAPIDFKGVCEGCQVSRDVVVFTRLPSQMPSWGESNAHAISLEEGRVGSWFHWGSLREGAISSLSVKVEEYAATATRIVSALRQKRVG